MNEFSYLERHMGTDVSLTFVCKEVAMADSVATETFATIHDYELRFSRFLPDSELSCLNQQGTLTVSTDFIAVLEKSIELYTFTAGAFNPLLQVRALGYTNTFADIRNTTSTLAPITYNTDLEKITINHTTHEVSLHANQQLDFGGLLKGYLATKLADDITKSYPACTGAIINIGGDIATRGLDELHEPFIFELYNPVTGEEIPTILTNTALATSGTYARLWQTSEGKRHHIIDATSLQNPTQNLVAVSIVHRDGAMTEALTKLFLVTGVTGALKRAPANRYQYQYFAVSSDGTIVTNLV